MKNNRGIYINPESNVPENGLYSFGISIPLARNLLFNERMANLEQAKLYTQQAVEDNKLMVNTILFEATLTYFNWLKAYQEQKVYESFLANAQQRF